MAENSDGGSWRAPQKQHILREHDSITALLQLIVDSVIVLGTLLLLVWLRSDMHFDMRHRTLAVVTVVLMWFLYSRFNVYQQQTGTLGAIGELLKAWGSVILILVLLGFVTKTSEDYSRQIIITWAVLSFVVQLAFRNIIPELAVKLGGGEKKKGRSLVVGAGELGKFLTQKINGNPWMTTKVVGVVDDNDDFLAKWNEPDVPTLGGTMNIQELLKEHNIGSIYIVLPMSESKTIERLYTNLVDQNIDINWAPDIFGMILINHNVKELAGVPLLTLSESPVSGSQALVKSLFDKFLSLTALILLSPVLIITAVAIKRESEGPILFKQKRYGWDQEVINVWKFRSMYVKKEDEEGEFKQATKDDPRVTKVGNLIRRLSIDELPQLFNVLQGTMSLVGPRPHPLELDNMYVQKINSYFARHRIKPGITGLAQVSGHRGETETLEKMKRRVEYDLEYINNWSIMLDLQILIKTVFTILFQKAY